MFCAGSLWWGGYRVTLFSWKVIFIQAQYQVEMVYGPLPLTIQTVLIVQASLIVGFNSAVWFLFLKRRNLRNKTNYFIASLSASHLFIGLFGIPCYVSSRRKPSSSLIFCTEVFYYFLCSSILNMYLVTYERYLSIMKPLYYHRRMGNSFVVAAICMAWIFPSIPITIDTLFRTRIKIHLFSLGYLVYHWMQTLMFLIIFLFLAAVNTAMFRVAKRQLQAIQAVHVINSRIHRRPSVQSSRREKRTTFFFVYIVTTFLVFWLPKIGCEVYELVHHKLLDHSNLDVMTLCIALLNPIFDPLIYLFFKADFKRAMRKMLRKRYVLRARESPIRNLSLGNWQYLDNFKLHPLFIYFLFLKCLKITGWFKGEVVSWLKNHSQIILTESSLTYTDLQLIFFNCIHPRSKDRSVLLKRRIMK